MSGETAETRKGAETADSFPGEEAAELKKLISASAPAAERSGGEEEPELNIALLSKEAGALKELLSGMSLDELLDYKARSSEIRWEEAAETPSLTDSERPSGGGESCSEKAGAEPEEPPLIKAELRPTADASYLERDLRMAGTVRTRRRGEAFDPPDTGEAQSVKTEAAKIASAPPPNSPEALQLRIADYEKGRRRLDSSGLQAVGFVFSFGFTVAAVILAFWWIAEYLVAHTGWNWLMAPFILAGAVFGLFLGIYMMLPYLRNLDRKKASAQDGGLDKKA